jgi:hypothetical protein
VLRDPIVVAWGPNDFTVFQPSDLRPPEDWDELARLRQTADR